MFLEGWYKRWEKMVLIKFQVELIKQENLEMVRNKEKNKTKKENIQLENARECLNLEKTLKSKEWQQDIDEMICYDNWQLESHEAMVETNYFQTKDQEKHGKYQHLLLDLLLVLVLDFFL